MDGTGGGAAHGKLVEWGGGGGNRSQLGQQVWGGEFTPLSSNNCEAFRKLHSVHKCQWYHTTAAQEHLTGLSLVRGEKRSLLRKRSHKVTALT